MKEKMEPFKFQKKNETEMIKASKEFYRIMKTRRSIRSFSDDPVPEEVIINSILSAGTAPSGANKQPWHFIAVSNPETKKKIREAAERVEEEFYQIKAPVEWLQALKPFETDSDKSFLEKAPYLIVVFLRKTNVDDNGKKQKNYYPSESVGIATGVLVSALQHAGLATLPYTPSPMGFLNEILDRPKTERPFIVLVTGYPAKDVTVPSIPKLPLEEVSSFDN